MGSPDRPLSKSQPGHRSYNLNERRRIGSMTGIEQARYQKVPTDESEAQTLASADLDYMKSEYGGWGEGHVGPRGGCRFQIWPAGLPLLMKPFEFSTPGILDSSTPSGAPWKTLL